MFTQSRASRTTSTALRPSARQALRHDRRGSIAVLAGMLFAVLAGLGAWSVNTYVAHRHGLMLRQTVQASALAAANKLTTYYTSGNNSSAAIVAAAQTLATANMPSANYGTVVPASNVVLGNWNPTTSVFTSLATSGGLNPDAVRVTGASTAANGNAVALLFTGITHRNSLDYTTSAIASFGNGQTFNTIIINDLSGSFSPSIASQRAADLAILDCIRTSSGTDSKFGLTTFTGHPTIHVALTNAITGYNTLKTKINAIKSCGNSGAPACSGSNAAAGIYSSIQQFSDAQYNNKRKNIVVITDGVPNASGGESYGRNDGTYPTPSSATPTCSGTNCTDAHLWTMAQNQAAQARAAGISITTIYYSGDTPSNQRAAYAAKLASLVGGTGVAMVAPTSGAISAVFAGFCATMSSSLKTVM